MSSAAVVIGAFRVKEEAHSALLDTGKINVVTQTLNKPYFLRPKFSTNKSLGDPSRAEITFTMRNMGHAFKFKIPLIYYCQKDKSGTLDFILWEFLVAQDKT